MRLVRTLLLSVVLLGAGAGFAYAAEPEMETEIGAASTPAQHQALADQYKAKAAESREQADYHRRMAKRYEQGKSILSQAGHCSSIAKRLDENAKDYDALAATEAKAAQAKN